MSVHISYKSYGYHNSFVILKRELEKTAYREGVIITTGTPKSLLIKHPIAW